MPHDDMNQLVRFSALVWGSTISMQICLILKFLSVPKIKIQEKSQILFCKILKKKWMVPCKSTAEEVSFEWSHHRTLSTDLKER